MKNITFEIAADMVKALNKQDKLLSYELFDQFYSYFKLNRNQERERIFVEVCGFVIARSTKII